MLLKGEPGEIIIDILERENTSSSEYWDANWLTSEVKIDILTFKAHYKTSLQVYDLQCFYDDLVRFQDLKTKEVEFISLDCGLYLKCISNKRGAIACTGNATDNYGNSLGFNLDTCLSAIDRFVPQLRSVLSKYPCVGKTD